MTMTSLNDVIESLDYVINIDSSPFTLSLSTGNVTHSEADLGMFSMFGRTGAPTKRGPTKAVCCRKAGLKLPDSCCCNSIAARVLHEMSMMTSVRVG